MTTAHEPRRGPDIHPSAEDLSALAEGAEPGADGVAEHLQDCAACRAEVDAIAELLTAFAELDAPALPQEVAIRIDAALVRESMARAARPGFDAVSHEAVSDEAAADGANFADAASGAGGATRSPSSSSADVGTTDSTRHPRPQRGSRRARWRGLGWGLASLVLVAGGVTLAFDLTSSSAGSAASTASGSAALSPNRQDSAGPLAQQQIAAPGTMIAAAPLVQLVKEILPTRKASETRADVGDAADSGCLTDPKFSKYQQLASANRTYQGTAATLVVYADGSDSSSVYAVAYATPCSTSSYRVLAEGVVSY